MLTINDGGCVSPLEENTASALRLVNLSNKCLQKPRTSVAKVMVNGRGAKVSLTYFSPTKYIKKPDLSLKNIMQGRILRKCSLYHNNYIPRHVENLNINYPYIILNRSKSPKRKPQIDFIY